MAVGYCYCDSDSRFLRAGQGANFPWAGNKFFLVRVQILACRGVLLLLMIFITSSTESVTA